jgi:two-component system nitrate/nitrite response regulator NarL
LDLCSALPSEGRLNQAGRFIFSERINRSGIIQELLIAKNDRAIFEHNMVKGGRTISVLVADDHVIFRDGLRKLLDTDEGLSVVGEAATGAACIKLLAKLKPDILLLDLRMPEKSGFAVLEEVHFDTLPTRVIVLTAAEDDRDVVRAVRLGARGVVLKQTAADVLLKSIHHVHAGEIWLDNRMTAEVTKAFSLSSERGPHREKLLVSDREKEIVRLVAQGYRNKEIGERLFISEQTVKNHLHNIFDKLGLSDRLELALYAIHHQMVEPP